MGSHEGVFSSLHGVFEAGRCVIVNCQKSKRSIRGFPFIASKSQARELTLIQCMIVPRFTEKEELNIKLSIGVFSFISQSRKL